MSCAGSFDDAQLRQEEAAAAVVVQLVQRAAVDDEDRSLLVVLRLGNLHVACVALVRLVLVLGISAAFSLSISHRT